MRCKINDLNSISVNYGAKDVWQALSAVLYTINFQNERSEWVF